jgi:hypothetical protein
VAIHYNTPLIWLLTVAVLCHVAYGARRVSPLAGRVVSTLQSVAPPEMGAEFVLALAIGADLGIALWGFFHYVYRA